MDIKTANFVSEFATRESGSEKIIEGYFIVYNQQTEIYRNFFEEIRAGACAESLVTNDVCALYNHNNSFIMGRKSAGSLTLRDDSYGVFGIVRVNSNDTEALNVYERVKRGDIRGCSFGFLPEVEEYQELDKNVVKCVVKKANVREISICPFPAYPQTQISARQQGFLEYRNRIDFLYKKEKLKEMLNNENINNSKRIKGTSVSKFSG